VGGTAVIAAALVPVAYVTGTFPTAVLVARRRGHDVLAEGSGNPGASNTFRLLGWRAGVVVLVIDLAKGALAAGVGLALAGHAGAYVLGGAAIIGHVYPRAPWSRRRGGRGVATGAGLALVVYPLISLVLGGLWALIAFGLRRASIASLVAVATFPVLVAVTGGPWPEIAVTTALAALVILRHSANLRRLVRGDEPTLDGRDGE
jgi:glycerol-3-phosphate acyltransferase PlsY